MAKATKVKKEEAPVIKVEETTVAEVIKQEDTPVEVKLPEVLPIEKPMEVKSPVEVAIEQVESSIEDAILAFVESRSTPEVRLNEFIKSLYGVPKPNTPLVCDQLTELKRLNGILTRMDKAGQLNFVNRQYQFLGKNYYTGEQQVSKKYTLNDINIIVKK